MVKNCILHSYLLTLAQDGLLKQKEPYLIFFLLLFFFAVEASGTFPASYVETIALKSLSCNVITNACECVSTELLGMVYHMDSMLVL